MDDMSLSVVELFLYYMFINSTLRKDFFTHACIIDQIELIETIFTFLVFKKKTNNKEKLCVG